MKGLGIERESVQAEVVRQRNKLQDNARPLVVFDLGGVVMRLDDLPLLQGLSETLKKLNRRSPSSR